jgi:hypothetical protein
MSVLYEKGSASWDLGIVPVRHSDGKKRARNGQFVKCARYAEWERTAEDRDAEGRLRLVLLIECTCGAGDSVAEMTSLRIVGSETTGQETLAGGTQNVTDGPGAGVPAA